MARPKIEHPFPHLRLRCGREAETPNANQPPNFWIEDEPMLRGMRKASSNWLGKIHNGRFRDGRFDHQCFRQSGASPTSSGGSVNRTSLAKVGSHRDFDRTIPARLYTDKLQQIGRQFGRPLTMEQGPRLRHRPPWCCSRPLPRATLDEEARRLGLPDNPMPKPWRTIFSDPNFKGVLVANSDPARFAVHAPAIRI